MIDYTGIRWVLSTDWYPKPRYHSRCQKWEKKETRTSLSCVQKFMKSWLNCKYIWGLKVFLIIMQFLSAKLNIFNFPVHNYFSICFNFKWLQRHNTDTGGKTKSPPCRFALKWSFMQQNYRRVPDCVTGWWRVTCLCLFCLLLVGSHSASSPPLVCWSLCL